MDAAVVAAMARWPDVPAAYGWLLLDARGRWRLRTSAEGDARFEPIANAALNAFIGRNYVREEGGAWVFQNGPQRVYVRLEAAPWILRLAPDGNLVTHTGQPAGVPECAAMDTRGRLFLGTTAGPGVIDDRDLADMLTLLVGEDGKPFDDDALDAWLESGARPGPWLRLGNARLEVAREDSAAVASRFGFVADPAPPPLEA
jgi:hypothetical protein